MNLTSHIRHFFRLSPATSIYCKARNDRPERIESQRISVPALHVGVLDYAPGELAMTGTALDGKAVRLYYPPEEVSAKKFLKSLETAPIVVGAAHELTTNEMNKKIDGWAATVEYDEAKQAAMLYGVVKGKDEIKHINDNKDAGAFGASAFIDFKAKIQSGTTPDGQPYDAIATDMRATHVALTDNVRDPGNKIEVRNRVHINSVGNCIADQVKNSEVKSVEISKEDIAAIAKNAAAEAVAAKNASDRLDKLEGVVTKLVNALEEKEKKEEAKNEEEKKEKKEEAKNEKEDEKEKKEEEKDGETVENSKPSQALIAVVASACNADFGRKTPSWETIGKYLGITETDPFARITAVNAKVAELSASTAKNAKTPTAGKATSAFGVYTDEAGV